MGKGWDETWETKNGPSSTVQNSLNDDHRNLARSYWFPMSLKETRGFSITCL